MSVSVSLSLSVSLSNQLQTFREHTRISAFGRFTLCENILNTHINHLQILRECLSISIFGRSTYRNEIISSIFIISIKLGISLQILGIRLRIKIMAELIELYFKQY